MSKGKKSKTTKKIIEELENAEVEELVDFLRNEQLKQKELSFIRNFIITFIARKADEAEIACTDLLTIVKDEQEEIEIRELAFNALEEISGLTNEIFEVFKSIKDEDLLCGIISNIKPSLKIDEMVNFLKYCFSHSSEDVRECTAYLVGTIDKEFANDILCEAITKESDEKILRAYMFVLGTNIVVEKVPFLIELLKKYASKDGIDNSYIVSSIISALGEIGDERAIQPLYSITKMNNYEIYSVINALEKIGGEKVRKLFLSLFKELTGYQNFVVLNSIYKMQIKEAIPIIIQKIKEDVFNKFDYVYILMSLEENTSGTGSKILNEMKKNDELSRKQLILFDRLKNSISRKIPLKYSILDIAPQQLSKRFHKFSELTEDEVHKWTTIEKEMKDIEYKNQLILEEKEKTKLLRLEQMQKNRWITKNYQLIDFIVKVILAIISAGGLIAVAIITVLLTKSPIGT